MKFISNATDQDNIDKKDIVLTQYNKRGIQINDNNEKVFAESRVINLKNNANQSKYHVLSYRGMIYDPYGIDSNRENSLNLKMKLVSENTFMFYVQYLQTRNSMYMTHAQRSFINA